jgi:hypothetical protein
MRLIDGGASRRGDVPPLPAADAAEVVASPIDPPAWLGAAALEVWAAWSPLATVAGTLTPATVENFVQLCLLEADRRELWARYQLSLDATGSPRALLYMSAKEEMATRREHRTLAKDIHARMKDFMIAPFGKELTPAGADRDVDPLDAFTRRQG